MAFRTTTLTAPTTLFPLFPLLLLSLVLLARPSHAFGAGNIGSTAKIEGTNWRHGDIEDTLLTLLTARAMGGKKFSKLDVKRVYFGNWLRDYSQAVDVGTVKYVSAEAIRLLLWILGFMSFGYGTGEFEVTRDRLGCYRPEEHIDNPKDYADNLDARQYDRRLRGPVDERKELAIDERTGLKHYIATEDIGITTSAGLVRRLFRQSIELGRRYKHSHNEKEFFEALRLMGTACHCLEDYSAHSNYTELALIELGERDIFPHVGRRTQIQLRGARHPVYPIVTGTFGGVDFLHSVMGEFSDKATQSEIQELEGTIQQSQRQDTSLLKELLSKLPSGLFGGTDQAGKADQLQANATAAQMQNMHITPKEPEAFTRQVEELAKQIYPILEFHDNILRSITETIDKIPILPELIEQIEEQVNIFVFSLMAPFILPIIRQVKEELSTGSGEIIQSSQEKQLIVFRDDNSTDPTHSMLSKDHFSNVLNEPAGKVASQVLKWVVPQIVACWDDDSIDIRRTNDRIIHGVFHHPALREMGQDGANDGRMAMFGIVKRWWGELDDRERNDLRRKLSRQGVESGQNHKEGVQDCGHGCGKPLGMPMTNTITSSGAIGGPAASAIIGGLGQALGGGGGYQGGYTGAGGHAVNQLSNTIGEAVGGGALGSIVGGLAGAVGGELLGSAFQGEDAEKKKFRREEYHEDGSYTSHITEAGHRPGAQGQQERYGQAEYSTTQFPGGGHREEYARYEQDGREGRTGYGFQQSTEVRPIYGGGYEQRTERRYENPGGSWDSEVQEQRIAGDGTHYARKEMKHGHRKKDSDSDSDDSDDSGGGGDLEKRQRKMRRKEEKRARKMREEEGRRLSGGGHSGGRGGGDGHGHGGGHRGGDGGGRREKSRSRSRERHHSRERRHSHERSREISDFEQPQQQPYSTQSYGEEASYGGGGGGYAGSSYTQQSSYGEQSYSSGSYGGGGAQSSYGGQSYGEQSQRYGEQPQSYDEQPYEEQSYGGGGGDGGYGRSDEYGYNERREY